MKVFISWSGKRSKALAIALRDWLPCVLQYVDPFVSEKDISAGDRWAQTIAGELEASNFGIICITPENLNSEWILFESGALSKSMQDGKVIPLLLDLELSDLSGPLAQFQAKKVEQSGLMETVQAINSVAENKASEDIITRAVPAMWPTLQSSVDEIPDKEPSEKHMRPQHEILEELVTGVRGISSRMKDFDIDFISEKERRFRKKGMGIHPRLFDEIMHMTKRYEEPDMALLFLSGLLRDEMPWMSEVLTETYRELRNSSPQATKKIRKRLVHFIEEAGHGRFGREFAESKTTHMLMMELPMMVERILDRYTNNNDLPNDPNFPEDDGCSLHPHD